MPLLMEKKINNKGNFFFSPQNSNLDDDGIPSRFPKQSQYGLAKPRFKKLVLRFQRLQSTKSKLPQHRSNEFHEQTTYRIGKGIPLQQIPNQSQTHRDCFSFTAERDPGEDMVPEQANETEKENEGGVDTARTDFKFRKQQQLTYVHKRAPK